MQKFWLLSRHDDGASIYEVYEPVMARSKSEIESKILACAEEVRNRYRAYHKADMELRDTKRADADPALLDAAVKRVMEAKKKVVRYVDINGFQVDQIVDGQGSICEDFEILSNDEFFTYKANRTPRLDAEGNPVRSVEVSVEPLVAPSEMHHDDLDLTGHLTVARRYLVIIEGADKDTTNYGIEDAALNAFHSEVSISGPECFSITARCTDQTDPDHLYGEVIRTSYAEEAPSPKF